MQRWIQPLYIYITAYCHSVMLPYTTGLKGSDMYLLRNVNGLLKKTSINTFPGKCQDDVQALRFSNTMYHVRLRVGQHFLYSCQNILFRSVDYFDILFRGFNFISRGSVASVSRRSGRCCGSGARVYVDRLTNVVWGSRAGKSVVAGLQVTLITWPIIHFLFTCMSVAPRHRSKR